MRLLHTKTLGLRDFGGSEVPKYAILSHTWGKEEVTLQDIQTNKPMESEGYEKVKMACFVAAAGGFDYIWIDTCCIDKTSSAELSEALNSMYRWYQEAEQCYAYLKDVQQNSINRPTDADVTSSEFRKSRWFTRGWTLQELIAPVTVIFLDSKWQEIGTKSNLQRTIFEITGIPGNFLLGDDIEYASVAQRMSWASKRETTRIEDLAYCLMGLFSIYMPMLYGEGEKAFIRLQEEIIKVSDDHSLFAWKSIEDHGGILATSPAAFADSGNIIPIDRSSVISNPSTINSRGVCLSLRFIDSNQQGTGLAILHCTEIGKEYMRFAVQLRDVFLKKQDFVREQSSTLELIDPEDFNLSQHPLTSIYVRQWRPTRNRKWEDIEKCVIKLEGMKGQDVALRTTNLNSNYELFDGLVIVDTAAIPDGILGRLLVVSKDGKFFQILLRKYGRSLSADLSTSTDFQDPMASKKEHNDQDQIVKELGGGHNVHVAIKKRVLLLHGRRCLTGVVEISYSSILKGIWLEHLAILEEKIRVRSLLSYAALRGLESVVRHLLDQESTESNLEDETKRTPLSWAAEGGQEAILKFLLGLKRNNNRVWPGWIELKGNNNWVGRGWIDSKDSIDRTPLSYAAASGHDAIVRHLLDTGEVDVDSKDSGNQTPLSYAAGNGHETVIRLLLDTGKVDADAKISWNQTPLSHAAKNGHDAVVQLLLDTGKVDADSKDSGKRTPLSYAAESGHDAVIRLLLDTGKVDTDSKDSWKRTPLSYAAENGHDAVVRLLLDTGKVDTDLKDLGNRTPLLYAAENGHDATVRLLLDTGKVDADSKDSWNQTPLSHAAKNGHDATVRLLLDTGKVDADSKSSWNQTPLSYAAESGHDATVRLLLDTGKVDADSKSPWNQTPLSYAARNGHDATVRLLLDTGKVDADSKGFENRTPLSYAAESGHDATVRLLLDTGKVDADSKNSWNQTPLSYAARNGHDATVRLLLDTGKVDADSKGFENRTSLSYAAENGHDAVVRVLLDTGKVDADSKDSRNQTPLSYAAENGHEAVVQLLRKYEK